MNTAYSINEFINLRFTDNYSSDCSTKIQHFFQTGLQEIINIFIGIYAKSFYESKTCPSGFTAKFEKSLMSPTLGNSLRFLIWLSGNDSNQTLGKLSEYFYQKERKNQGVISKMISLRNLWAHTKEASIKEVFDEAISLLNEFCLFDSFGELVLASDNKVYWIHNNESICIDPFCINIDEKLVAFESFVEPGKLIFKSERQIKEIDIMTVWGEFRILDALLDNPSRTEISAKLNKELSKFISQDFWWKDQLALSKKNVFLVHKGFLLGILGKAKIENPQWDIVSISIINNEKPLELISRKIGISPVENSKKLVEIFNGNKIIIGISTEGLNSKYFSRLLDWVSDLLKIDSYNNILVIIERRGDQLIEDQNLLWDRLPENLNEIFAAPTLKNHLGLIQYQWPITKPKRYIFF